MSEGSGRFIKIQKFVFIFPAFSWQQNSRREREREREREAYYDGIRSERLAFQDLKRTIPCPCEALYRWSTKPVKPPTPSSKRTFCLFIYDFFGFIFFFLSILVFLFSF
jgi:hypothetical protein